MPITRLKQAADHCSFCGKAKEQVQRLIAGPGGVFICNDCVELCRDIVTGEASPRRQAGTPCQYHGGHVLDNQALPASAQQLFDTVIAPVAAVPGTTVTVTLTVYAQTATGFPAELVQRVVSAAKTLRLQTSRFR